MKLLPRIANAVLSRFGYVVRPQAQEPAEFSMDGVLSRLRRRGVEVRTVVDLGAAAGRWTRRALRHLPDAKFLLVEPLEERRSALDAMCAQNPNVEYALAAAGPEPGETSFTVAPDLDGSGVYDGTGGRKVPVISLDDEIPKRGLPAPFLLKFDTHGFELPILAGASATLRSTSAILMECYNFKLTDGCLRFHEMCALLDGHGFRPADIAEPMLRPGDQLLWQLDILFLRKDAPFFRHEQYQPPASS